MIQPEWNQHEDFAVCENAGRTYISSSYLKSVNETQNQRWQYLNVYEGDAKIGSVELPVYSYSIEVANTLYLIW